VVAPPSGGGGGGGGGELYCSIPDYGPKEVSVAEGDEVQEAVTIKVFNMLGTDITAKVHVSISDPTGKEINSTIISVKVNHCQTKFLPVTLSFKPLTSGTYTIHAYAESSAIKPAGKTTEKTKSISVTVTPKAPPPPPAFVLPIEVIIAVGLIIAVVAGALWISMKRKKPLTALVNAPCKVSHTYLR
jgi:nitrogen fixation protein FixH